LPDKHSTKLASILGQILFYFIG